MKGKHVKKQKNLHQDLPLNQKKPKQLMKVEVSLLCSKETFSQDKENSFLLKFLTKQQEYFYFFIG